MFLVVSIFLEKESSWSCFSEDVNGGIEGLVLSPADRITARPLPG